MNKYVPLYFTIAYLVVTMLLSFLGPVVYFNMDVRRVTLFMFGIMASITVGYFLGANVKPKLAQPMTDRRVTLDRIFLISLALGLIGLVLTIYDLIRGGNFNTNLSDLGSVYLDSYEGYERNSGSYSLIFIIYSLAAAPTFIATVWGLFYFKQLDRLRKILVLTLILGTLFTFTIGSGKQKQLGDVIIYVAAIFGLRAAMRGKVLSLKTTINGAVLLVGGVLGLTLVLSQRYDALSINAFNVNSHVMQSISYDLDHPVFRLFGYHWGLALAMFSGYLSQGYYGLSLALNTPTTWSHFLGFSYSVSVIANRVLGIDFPYLSTYPYIAGSGSGWGEAHWYTVFPWFASDVSFLGTIPLFGYFAYIYARTWRESVEFANPFAILMFCMLSLGAVYMPANNQLVHSPGGLATLILVVFLYARNGKRFNRRQAR